MPMKTAAIIRHVHFEDLGSFAEPLTRAGYEFTYYDVGHALPPRDPAATDLLIVLGAPVGVYEDDKYPFLRDEIDLLTVRLKATAANARHLPRVSAHRLRTRRKSLSLRRQGDRLGADRADRGRRVHPAPAFGQYSGVALAWRHIRSASGCRASRLDSHLPQSGFLPRPQHSRAAVSPRGGPKRRDRSVARRPRGGTRGRRNRPARFAERRQGRRNLIARQGARYVYRMAERIAAMMATQEAAA